MGKGGCPVKGKADRHGMLARESLAWLDRNISICLFADRNQKVLTLGCYLRGICMQVICQCKGVSALCIIDWYDSVLCFPHACCNINCYLGAGSSSFSQFKAFSRFYHEVPLRQMAWLRKVASSHEGKCSNGDALTSGRQELHQLAAAQLAQLH